MFPQNPERHLNIWGVQDIRYCSTTLVTTKHASSLSSLYVYCSTCKFPCPFFLLQLCTFPCPCEWDPLYPKLGQQTFKCQLYPFLHLCITLGFNSCLSLFLFAFLFCFCNEKLKWKSLIVRGPTEKDMKHRKQRSQESGPIN